MPENGSSSTDGERPLESPMTRGRFQTEPQLVRVATLANPSLIRSLSRSASYGRLPASERGKVRFGEHFLRWLARPSPAKVLGRFAVPEGLRRKGVGVRRVPAGPESSQVFGRKPFFPHPKPVQTRSKPVKDMCPIYR